jgi:hypothetical protein
MTISFTFEKLISHSFKRLLKYLKNLGFGLKCFETIFKILKKKRENRKGKNEKNKKKEKGRGDRIWPAAHLLLTPETVRHADAQSLIGGAYLSAPSSR